ncbi:hypothetical protein Q5Y75_26895 [Ruegeria sp. 2205SS24-7]|uniref:hypothetical protein n=1 Tax=Ruegeria discodermiae TaxID=3064389 RepID=UPI002741DC91|nr:hypothetical protein [Ruegeria sp. 2205SS24-7]MDP5220819.1 hypothetical protein [Ruegeria sp. 2205SS24-7]
MGLITIDCFSVRIGAFHPLGGRTLTSEDGRNRSILGVLAIALCNSAAVVSAAQTVDPTVSELDHIQGGFARVDFDTRPLVPQADRQMPGCDYKALIDASFRRAGMLDPMIPKSCTETVTSSSPPRRPC